MTPDLILGFWFCTLVLASSLILPSTLIWIAEQ